MEKNKERTERELKSQHPLLSRIKPWLKRQLKRADAERASQHTWDAHVKAIGKNKLVINTCVSQVYRCLFEFSVEILMTKLLFPYRYM